MLHSRSVFAPRRSLAAAALLVSAAACGGGGGDSGGTGVKQASTAAAVTVPAQISVPSNSGALTVQVAATYDRSSGAAGALATQTVTLSGSGAQNVPFTLDLAPCLNDAARAGGSSSTSCAVRLQLTLLAGGTAVDAQSVGPYTLAGASKTTTSGVTFVAVASVQVAPASGAVAGNAARVVLASGTTLPLAARVLDANGNALSGRAVSWSSSATGVATVDAASGVVTPVSVGSTTVTAAVAGQKGSITVNVVLPPQQVTVTAGTGSGSGTVVSTRSGSSSIACRVVNGAASGTCTLAFPSDSAVVLTARPDANNKFTGWNAAACAGGVTDSTCTFTPGAPVSVAAAFASTATTRAALTLSTAGAGGGYVTSAQAGTAGVIDCHRIGGVTLGATCSSQFATGTQVTLTATPDGLSTFAGWSGACASSGPTCVVTLGTADAVPVATFAASPSANGVSVAPVTATGLGSGSLTVTTTVQSAPCTRDQVNRPDGGTCIAPWNPANVPATIIVTATAASGSRFVGFTGCPTATTDNTCKVPANGVYAVSATFDP